MLRYLTTLISRGKGTGPGSDGHVISAPLAPERPVLAVGDIHGCARPFTTLLDRYTRLQEDPRLAGLALVLLGDMVDRGPDSRAVLIRARDMTRAMPEDVICLTGNHELMLLDFIDDPLGRGLRWLAFGGAETLSSFDIPPPSHKKDPDRIMAVADQLEQALRAEGLLDWLRVLPDRWSTGNLACVHAAMAPDQPLDRQNRRHLCWGHPDFARQPRTDGLWVVHGHTISPKPICAVGRIALDTGAFQGGPLSAALLTPGQCRFLQV